MQYIAQSRKACLAYALLQIGAVSREAVSEYERFIKARKFTSANIDAWLDRHAQWCKLAPGVPTGNAPDKFDLSGRGLVVINIYRPRGRKIVGRHALSYEAGKVLDPGRCSIGLPMTWPAYAAWSRDRLGSRVEISEVIPAV